MSWRVQQRGITLVETMVAVLVAMAAVAALGGTIFTAMVHNKNEGQEITQAIALAQGKMEQLLSLDFADTTTNLTGITDAGWGKGLKAGGTLTQVSNCPGASVGYAEFLDAFGNQITGPCSAISGFAYVRQWTITDTIASSSGPPRVFGLKQISVSVSSVAAVGTGSRRPSVELTTYKPE